MPTLQESFVESTSDASVLPEDYLPVEGNRLREGSPFVIIRAIRQGLPFGLIDWVKREFDLSGGELADVLGIATRTINRRKKSGRLNTDESARLFNLILLYEKAADTFESAKEAREWMREPNFALGDDTPLQVATTSDGAVRVEKLLGQIEHGIVA